MSTQPSTDAQPHSRGPTALCRRCCPSLLWLVLLATETCTAAEPFPASHSSADQPRLGFPQALQRVRQRLENSAATTPAAKVPNSSASGQQSAIQAPAAKHSRAVRTNFQTAESDDRPLDSAPAPPAEGDYVVDRVEARQELELIVGRPQILRLKHPPFRDQISDPALIDLLNITETEYTITGREVGTAVLNFWFENQEAPGGQEIVSFLLRIVEDPETGRRLEALLRNLEQEINRAFPNSAINLTYVGRQVVVRGQAKDVEEATQILRIVAQSVPGAQDAENPFNPNQFFSLGASAEDLNDAGGLANFLRGQTPSGVNSANINSRIINLLQIAGVQQVMLKVTVAEVNRSAARAIGADLSIGGQAAQFVSLLPIAELGIPQAGGNLLVNANDFGLAITALKQLNLAKSLAEPNIVALNGQPANFQVGGEFPVPQLSGFTGAGLQGVEFVPFGVQLNFIPVVTDVDRVRLNLRATVSTRNEAIGTTIGGVDSAVSGLNTRNFQTTVELRDGQTLAIAGLIQTNAGSSSDRVPFFGDIPYFGRLFSADRVSYDEQELLVLVTPYLVAPVNCDTPLAIPGSDYFEPDDVEFFLRGSIVGHFEEDNRTAVRTDLHKIKEFRRLEQRYIIGRPGHSNGLPLPSGKDGRLHPPVPARVINAGPAPPGPTTSPIRQDHGPTAPRPLPPETIQLGQPAEARP